MLFFHQNIRSATRNFEIFITYLNFLENKPNIIILSEAWIVSNDEAALYSISDC